MLNFYNLNSPLSPIQIHLYIIVFCLIHSFPFSPGLLLFVLSFQTFPVVSQLPRAKSVPQLIILMIPTNRRYKLDRRFHHSFLFAPFHSHSRSDFTILSQVTFKHQLWFCTNYVGTDSFYLSDHFLGYHFSRWGWWWKFNCWELVQTLHWIRRASRIS